MRFVFTSLLICLLLYGIKADWSTPSSPSSLSSCKGSEEYRLLSTSSDVSYQSLYNEKEVPLSYPEWVHLIEQLNPPGNLDSSFIVYPVWDSTC